MDLLPSQAGTRLRKQSKILRLPSMRMLRQAGSFSDGSIMPPLPKRPDWTCGRERVVIFGNPKAGTLAMTKSATLAIDLPMKALVWQDDQDRGWLTYNTSRYNAN